VKNHLASVYSMLTREPTLNTLAC